MIVVCLVLSCWLRTMIIASPQRHQHGHRPRPPFKWDDQKIFPVRSKCFSELYAGSHHKGEICLDHTYTKVLIGNHPVLKFCEEDRNYYNKLKNNLQERINAKLLESLCCGHIRGLHQCPPRSWSKFLVYEYFSMHFPQSGIINPSTPRTTNTSRIKVECFAQQFGGRQPEQCKSTSLVGRFLKNIPIINICEEDEKYLDTLSMDPAEQKREVQTLYGRCCAHFKGAINCLPQDWGHFLLLKYAIEHHILFQSINCFAEQFAGAHENMCQSAIAQQILTDIPLRKLCEEDRKYLDKLSMDPVERNREKNNLQSRCCRSLSVGPIHCSSQDWGHFLVLLYAIEHHIPFFITPRTTTTPKTFITPRTTTTPRLKASMIFPTHDVEVYEDSADVELPCGVRGQYSRCEWEHGGGAVVRVEDVRNLLLYDKPKNSKDNQCGITIKRVELYFKGQWTCKIFANGKTLLKTLDLTVLDRVPEPYHRYSGLYFTDKQCPNISHHYGQPFQRCEKKCDETDDCSVFNYHSGKGQTCILINCGKFPPYPIGTGIEWQSFSKKEIKIGYTRYHGPYSKIWHAEQGCNYLKDIEILRPNLLYATYFDCQKVCDRNQACTGFNFDNKKYDCYLMHCSDPTLAPDKKLNGWESWSRMKIKEYTSVYHKYDLTWTNKQCRFISDHRKKSQRECEYLCNAQTGCTAFNWKNYERGCELYKCSTTPPFPIGAIKGWNGYSTYKITSAGRYYGPYGVYWENTQCNYIRTHYYLTRVECEDICDSTVNCTGFNFKRERGNCVMIQCATIPPPEPSGNAIEWESFSKTKLQEEGVPLIKCPSYHCREENIPNDFKKFSWRHRRTYCCDHPDNVLYECGHFCSCHSNIFCWYNCDKCRELRNNDPLTKYFQSKSN